MNNIQILEQEYNKEIQKISDEINKSEEERIGKLSHLKTFEEEKEGMGFFKRTIFSFKKFFKITPITAIFGTVTSISLSIFVFFQSQELTDLPISFLLLLFFQAPLSIAYIFFEEEYMEKISNPIKEIKKNRSKSLIEESFKNPVSVNLMKTFKSCFNSEEHFQCFLIGAKGGDVTYEMINDFVISKKDKNNRMKTINKSLKEKEVML